MTTEAGRAEEVQSTYTNDLPEWKREERRSWNRLVDQKLQLDQKVREAAKKERV
jgi:hypothetical protein